VSSAGDQDEAVGRAGQQGSDLGAVLGVVEDEDGSLPGDRGTPERRALVQTARQGASAVPLIRLRA
jgi:hypothetical protein